MWGQTDTVIDSFAVNQVSRGDKGESVRTLQSALLEIGRGLNIKNSGGADGSFGRGTEKDVLDFQKLMGLSRKTNMGCVIKSAKHATRKCFSATKFGKLQCSRLYPNIHKTPCQYFPISYRCTH